MCQIWGCPKMTVPNNHGFSYTKNDHLGCFGGTTILGDSHMKKKTSSPLFLQHLFCWGWPSWTTIGLAWIVWLMNCARTRAFQERLSDQFQLFFFSLRCLRSFPRGSVMYGVFACICLHSVYFFLGTVGKYTLHGSSWILRVCVKVIFFCVFFCSKGTLPKFGSRFS